MRNDYNKDQNNHIDHQLIGAVADAHNGGNIHIHRGEGVNPESGKGEERNCESRDEHAYK